MLKTDVDALWQEWAAARETTEGKLFSLKDQKRRYHGPSYDQSTSEYDAQYDPINYGFSYVSLLRNACVAANPRPIIESKRPAVQSQDAKALELGLTRWMEEIRFRDVLDKLIVDYAMCYGVGHLTREPAPGEQEHSDPIYWPQFNRLDPREVSWDAEAKSWESKRFVGHVWRIDKDDLLKMAEKDSERIEGDKEGWNLEMIRRLEPNAKYEEWQSESEEARKKKSGLREQIEIHELWLPEVTLPEAQKMADEQGKTPAQLGYHGSLYYLAYGVWHDETRNVRDLGPNDKKAHFVRKPQPYYGPRTGPYYLFGEHVVPNESHPLGALTAAEAQIRSVNEIARSNHDMARSYKRFFGYDESENAAIKNAKQSEHEDFVPLPMPETGKLADAIVPMELGGLTQQGLSQYELEKDIADQTLGLSEAQRGNVAGGTATENAIAAGTSSARVEGSSDKFERCTLEVMRGAAELLWMDDEVLLPMGSAALEDRGYASSFYMGGRPSPERLKEYKKRYPNALWPEAPADGPEDETGATFNDLELTIAVGSMGRKSEAQRRGEGMALMEFGSAVAPMLPQLAMSIGIEGVKSYLEALEDRTGIPYLVFFNPDQLAMATQMMAQPQSGDPRLSRTTGAMPQYTSGSVGGGGSSPQFPGGGQMGGMQAQQGLSTGQMASSQGVA